MAAGPGPAPAVPDVSIDVGDSGLAGGVTVHDQNDEPVISLNGANGLASFGTGRGAGGTIMVRSDRNGPVILATGTDGRITFLDASLNTTLVIDGILGDIELMGADCAEEFEAAEPSEPGAVMCLDDAGRLRPCVTAYDRRVVGVVSGAGGLRPALRLNSRPTTGHGAALALVGKVYCLVDAELAPIEIGDLLTTSATRGHAMKATSDRESFGAVLGKSLGPLRRGQGLVPVLIALQ